MNYCLLHLETKLVYLRVCRVCVRTLRRELEEIIEFLKPISADRCCVQEIIFMARYIKEIQHDISCSG